MTQTLLQENPDAENVESPQVEESHFALIAENPEMKRVLKMAENAATSKATILITGASGSGKDVLANYIHSKSARARKKLMSVDCGAIPEGQVESEIFGVEKPGVNGVPQVKLGKIELAHGSTLVIDEISALDARTQSKLLRALQEEVIDRVNGKSPVKVNVRLICTSARDLKRCVDAGTFRKELYFRLNVVPIHIPALKARKEDIIPLMKHFLTVASKNHNKTGLEFTQGAFDKAMNYSWPGNVRELSNAVSRAVLLADSSSIGEELFTFEAAPETTSMSFEWRKMTLGDIERWVIIERLKEFSGNRTHSSRALGISIRTLRNKIREYKALGIDVP